MKNELIIFRMNYFKIIEVFFFIFLLLSHTVYSPITGEDLQFLLKVREDCCAKIIKKFGSYRTPILQARFAFDYFKDGNTELNDEPYEYYKEFSNKLIPLQTTLYPENFCRSQRFRVGNRLRDCIDELKRVFGNTPSYAIWNTFYNKQRATTFYNEANNVIMFNEDVVGYWEHLKMGFHLENFPRLDHFCASIHTQSRYNIPFTEIQPALRFLTNVRMQCCDKIIEKFGGHTDQILQARHAFDNLRDGLADFNGEPYDYFKFLNVRVYPLQTTLDPLYYCRDIREHVEYRLYDCIIQLQRVFGKTPLAALRRSFFDKQRESTFYHEANGVTVYNEDVVGYWDHLKMGFRLVNLPSLEKFCSEKHPASRYKLK